jgi:hypothetical protein
MKEIKITSYIARNDDGENTRVFFLKPLKIHGRFKIKNPYQVFKSKNYITVKNFLNPGKCEKVEIIIREKK